jgi:peptidoglycan hydrolase-like protein with peptidoglycan-binding domain
VGVDELKQKARDRRGRRFRIWLTTLSWSMPVVAFTGFFSVWHNLSTTTKTAPHSFTSPSAINTQTTGSTTPVLFKIGSRGPQVMTIQEQLSELGYFNHSLTKYYGSVTADAIKSFQTDNGLSGTGQVDSETLRVLQQAVKSNRTSAVTSTGSIHSSDTSGTRATQSPIIGSPGSADTGTGSVAPSQQQIPDTTSGAS